MWFDDAKVIELDAMPYGGKRTAFHYHAHPVLIYEPEGDAGHGLLNADYWTIQQLCDEPTTAGIAVATLWDQVVKAVRVQQIMTPDKWDWCVTRTRDATAPPEDSCLFRFDCRPTPYQFQFNLPLLRRQFVEHEAKHPTQTWRDRPPLL